MRLPSLGLVAVLAAQAVADSFITYSRCVKTMPCDSSKSVWWNDFGQPFGFDGGDQCRNPGVPNVVEVCMDWNRERASFKTFLGNWRCLRKQASRRESFSLLFWHLVLSANQVPAHTQAPFAAAPPSAGWIRGAKLPAPGRQVAGLEDLGCLTCN